MRALKLAVAALVLLAAVGCATNPAPNVTPQTRVASYGAKLLDALTAVQDGVTAAARTSPAFVPTARTITGVMSQIHEKAGKLGDALRAYDAATNLDVKKLKEAEVNQIVADILALVGNVLKVPVDPGIGGQVYALVANVLAVITNLQGALAKGLAS